MKQTVSKNRSINSSQGKLITNGVILQPHEQRTVNFLLSQNLNVELIPLTHKEGERTADIRIQKIVWEMKAPRGSGRWTIKNIVQKASHQSENMIIDLFRIKIYEPRCLSELQRYFKKSKRIKRMKVVTKSKNIIDFNKK